MRTIMSKHIYKAVMVAALTGLAVGGTGCKCVCPANKQAGLAIIVCQPMDQQVSPKEDAVFEVMAKGSNLSYQWFFERNNNGYAMEDAHGPRLVVPASRSPREGFYSCLINSASRRGVLQTRTRLAALVVSPSMLLQSTNPPPQPGLPNPTTTTTSPCCANVCAFINFNNNGTGYVLSQSQKFIMKLTSDPAGLNVINTSSYCAQWRYGGQSNQAGCLIDRSSAEKQFIAPVAARYIITIYLKSPCPPSGTVYYLWLIDNTSDS
jgi:hypothetical protein